MLQRDNMLQRGLGFPQRVVDEDVDFFFKIRPNLSGFSLYKSQIWVKSDLFFFGVS